MRKKFLSLFLCALMTVGITACQSAPADNTDDNGDKKPVADKTGPVELNVWAEQDNFEMLNKMIDSFKKQYPEQEITINLVPQSDADVRDDMLRDVHNGADVFHFPDDQLNSLVAGVFYQQYQMQIR